MFLNILGEPGLHLLKQVLAAPPVPNAGLELKLFLPLLANKFPDSNINYYHMIKSLAYFDDAEHEAWPIMHKTVQWEEVKVFFLQQQRLLLDKYLQV